MASPAGCLGRVLAIVAIALILAVAWLRAPDFWDRGAPETDLELREADPAVAGEVLDRIERLLRGEVDRVALSEEEVESVLRHPLLPHLPEGVSRPSLRLAGGEARLGARIATSRLPMAARWERVQALLPDSVPIELRGTVLTLHGGETVFLPHRIDLAGVPLPGRALHALAEALDPGAREHLPSGALRVPLPSGVDRAYIERNTLVIEGPS